MKCLHCGHCCINYEVVIVDNPLKGIKENNLIHKKTGNRCPHLIGIKIGEFLCAIHDKKWYKKTPCFAHTQIERISSPCRIGEYLLNKTRKISCTIC